MPVVVRVEFRTSKLEPAANGNDDRYIAFRLRVAMLTVWNVIKDESRPPPSKLNVDVRDVSMNKMVVLTKSPVKFAPPCTDTLWHTIHVPVMVVPAMARLEADALDTIIDESNSSVKPKLSEAATTSTN